MAVVNAPYQLDKTLAGIMPILAGLLAQGRFSHHQVEWLVSE